MQNFNQESDKMNASNLLNTQDKKIYSFINTIDFECQRCSNCCRKEPGAVFLTEEDLNSICKLLQITQIEFIKKYCRGLYKNDKFVLSLLEKINYDCIFWDNGCLIYEARPVQCRTYPYWPFLLESKKSWLEESNRCKGINKKSNMTTDQKFSMYKLEKNVKIFELKSS